ncbi:peptidoglycan-binding protein [Streptomyces violascens]|uniref:peptidoglycan-binding protein n=1 Tax=Streptomyces violascens TaxID=67381 RepID=UPI0036ABB091
MTADDRTEALPAVRAESDVATEEESGAAAGARSARRSPASRKKWLIGAAVVGVLAITAGGLACAWPRTDTGGPSAAGPSGSQTVAVVRTDLSQEKSMAGTLGFGTAQPVKGHGPGTVTWLPKPGDTLDQGGQLARVNDKPVTVFRGAMPLYRTLGAPLPPGDDQKASDSPDAGKAAAPGDKDKAAASGATGKATASGAAGKSGDQGASAHQTPAASTGASGGAGAATGQGDNAVAGPGTEGADVKLLEENLYALGFHDFGHPDTQLTDATVTAIKHWQKSLGLPDPTGRVSPDDVQVLPGKVRVGAVKAHLGDSAAEELLTVTATDKVVTVPVAVSDLSIAGRGTPVTVVVPDGTPAKGKVASVGTATTGSTDGQDGSGDGKGQQGGAQEAKVPVTVALDDPRVAGSLDGAQVTADFASEARKGVLAVPVGALVALREGGYALQLPAQQVGQAARLVPVKTGMFAKGLVEVCGADVKEGVKVVTTA